MSYIKQLNAVLDSPAYSNSLKRALIEFDRRDCLDAMRDAELMASLLNLKLNDIENQAQNLRNVFYKGVA